MHINRMFSNALETQRERQRKQSERDVQKETGAQDPDAWLTGEEYRRLVHHPTAAWRHLAARYPDKTVVREVVPKPCDSPKPPNCVRFVCISDTHNQSRGGPRVPDGDVLIHAGDFTMEGYSHEVEEFVAFLQTLPHKHKIVIAGNHDIPFDPDVFKLFLRYGHRRSSDTEDCPRLLQGVCTYLQDSEVTVEGYRVYGAPCCVPSPSSPFRGSARLQEVWQCGGPQENTPLLAVCHGNLGHSKEQDSVLTELHELDTT